MKFPERIALRKNEMICNETPTGPDYGICQVLGICRISIHDTDRPFEKATAQRHGMQDSRSKEWIRRNALLCPHSELWVGHLKLRDPCFLEHYDTCRHGKLKTLQMSIDRTNT